MNKSEHIYHIAIQKVIDDEDKLPSLPSVTLKIRQAISNPDSDLESIAKLVRLDPSLSALLLKYAASPLYKRPVPPKTIEAVLAMIGMPALESLVMTHSIKSLFILKNPQLKKLFQLSWERMICKAAISQFVASKLGYKPAEQAMTSSLLTEIGTLVLLSTFSSNVDIPDQKTYIHLCRSHSKVLSGIVINKWGLDKKLSKISHYAGRWDLNITKNLSLIDVLNIAIYSTVQHQSPDNNLPPIKEIVSYKKLPHRMRELSENNQLLIIKDNIEEINTIITTLT